MSAETAAYTARMDLESDLTVKLINHVLGVEKMHLRIMKSIGVHTDERNINVGIVKDHRFASTIG